jgi:hypothetical protein
MKSKKNPDSSAQGLFADFARHRRSVAGLGDVPISHSLIADILQQLFVSATNIATLAAGQRGSS